MVRTVPEQRPCLGRGFDWPDQPGAWSLDFSIYRTGKRKSAIQITNCEHIDHPSGVNFHFSGSRSPSHISSVHARVTWLINVEIFSDVNVHQTSVPVCERRSGPWLIGIHFRVPFQITRNCHNSVIFHLIWTIFGFSSLEISNRSIFSEKCSWIENDIKQKFSHTIPLWFGKYGRCENLKAINSIHNTVHQFISSSHIKVIACGDRWSLLTIAIADRIDWKMIAIGSDQPNVTTLITEHQIHDQIREHFYAFSTKNHSQGALDRNCWRRCHLIRERSWNFQIGKNRGHKWM